MQGALEAAETAVERSDGHPQYLRMLGGICLRLGYYNKATKTYEKLLNVYERGYPAEKLQKRDVIDRLGQLYILQQAYSDAVKSYRTCRN